LISPATGVTMDESPWVHIGGEYTVLGISAVPDSKVRIQIITDDGAEDPGPGWFDLEGFITVDSAVPTTWRAVIDEHGVLDIEPEAWATPGFWEDYFDGDPVAQVAFAKQLAIIEADQGEGIDRSSGSGT
jgi:hypothetical protein